MHALTHYLMHNQGTCNVLVACMFQKLARLTLSLTLELMQSKEKTLHTVISKAKTTQSTLHTLAQTLHRKCLLFMNASQNALLKCESGSCAICQ